MTATATKKPSALHRLLTPSPILAAAIGAEAVARTDAVKKIWDYIKAHNLQDSANKRNINADAVLKPLFGGRDQVTMFELTKFLSLQLS